jgi:hypothetical protein
MVNSSCYVYVYEFDGVVRYIGEGRGRRMENHRAIASKYADAIRRGEPSRRHRFYTNYALALITGSAPNCRKVAEGLTKREAIDLQNAEIARYPAEQLWNSILSQHPWMADEQAMSARNAAMKAFWASPDGQAVAKTLWADPERRERQRAVQKAYWASPEGRAKRAAAAKARCATPEGLAAIAAARAAAAANPEVRERQNAGLLSNATNPEKLARRNRAISAARSRPETKKKITAALKSAWNAGKYQDRRRAKRAQG